MFSFKKDSLTQSSVKLEWKPGFDGGLPQIFIIEYKRVSDDDWSNVSISDSQEPMMQYTLTDLTPDTDYVSLLFAFNDIGASETYGLITFRTLSSKGSLCKSILALTKDTTQNTKLDST